VYRSLYLWVGEGEKMANLRIVITMGDPAGIGPEIILKSLGRLGRKSIPVIVGDYSVMEEARNSILPNLRMAVREIGAGTLGETEFLDARVIKQVTFGKSDAECGRAAYKYITEALKLVFSGEAAAVVTCPITKKSIRAAGIEFIGHTEMMAHYSGSAKYVMMMVNRRLRVSLVTIHVPLRDVPHLVTAETVFRSIAITALSLRTDFGITRPHIKVCGLNPHAGEAGIMGDEEVAISAAIERAQAMGIWAEGPFPADSLFHRFDCDVYLAMYHDQGLIPVKTVDFARTVNITLGLPVVRTSVGHGTGLDIAGVGIADPTSLIEAYKVAEAMAFSRG
jgi:4-hydroxythreonine-4-phosphate dehydrogenase